MWTSCKCIESVDELTISQFEKPSGAKKFRQKSKSSTDHFSQTHARTEFAHTSFEVETIKLTLKWLRGSQNVVRIENISKGIIDSTEQIMEKIIL